MIYQIVCKTESVSLWTGRIDCLLYADDVIIFSNSSNGLQDCLNANA